MTKAGPKYLTVECEFPTFHSLYAEGSDSVMLVRLRANALLELLDDTDQDHRIYELWSLQMPGDVCAYVSVELLSDPKTLSARVSHEVSTEFHPYIDTLRSGKEIQLEDFEELFRANGDDVCSGALEWEKWRRGSQCQDYLNRLLEEVRSKMATLRTSSVLVEHIVRPVISRSCKCRKRE